MLIRIGKVTLLLVRYAPNLAHSVQKGAQCVPYKALYILLVEADAGDRLQTQAAPSTNKYQKRRVSLAGSCN